MKTNRVEINLPFSGPGDLPDPKKPVVSIDGVPLEGVTAISITAGVDEITTVSIDFYAEVFGVVVPFTMHELDVWNEDLAARIAAARRAQKNRAGV